MNEIIKELNFKYKFIDNLLIYKNFTSKKLNELLEKYNYDYVFNSLIEYIENNFDKDKKKKNLIGTSILKNFEKCINEIENYEINDNDNNIDLYYTNYKEVEHLINNLNENKIKQYLKI